MELYTLQVIWFGLLGVLFVGYAILDGFDLGVGMLQIFHKTDRERRIALNAVGPVWDGNEVWLLTAGGAIFAAFPQIYAEVFSGFYTALILLLGALIFRAISLEFRSKFESESWRRFWDWAFAIGSFLIALLLGVALGNIVDGVYLNEHGNIDAGMFGLLYLLRPIPLLSGALSVALLALHGALFLILKTEGQMHSKIIAWLPRLFLSVAVLILALSAFVLLSKPVGNVNMREYPFLQVLPFAAILSLFIVKFLVQNFKFFWAFLGTSLAILFLIASVGVGMFPMLVPVNGAPEQALTIANSASAKTLQIMFIIACIGVPIVLAYTVMIYRIFKNKPEIGPESY